MSSLTGMLPLVLMFVVLYFVMIRPQMKRQKEHRAMIDALAKGDEVATAGGIIGKVTRLSEGFLHIEIANNVEGQIQRSAVVQVQQQIGVLAAEQRSLDEQSRQLDSRYERLRADRNALAAPDEARLNNLRSQLEAAQEQAETTEARLAELQDTVPQLDEDRRARQQDVNTESARQTDLSARMEALKALQEKVKTDGKLRPWLAKHGLDGLQGLWSRIHIEPGWENALEAALRERLGALEVGRLEMVRGFLGSGGNDAPPARLAFYSAPAR